jgi:hypothetical protein
MLQQKEVIYATNLHFEHERWRSELLFWEGELRFFTKRLEELVLRWTDKNVLAQLEHYQNQFILHGEVIDTLKHDINVHETDLSTHSKRKEDVLNQELVKKHIEFRHRMETQQQIFANLKMEFFKYLSKYM